MYIFINVVIAYIIQISFNILKIIKYFLKFIGLKYIKEH